ncbi:MAG TPA: hypothetical protein VHA37_03895, partial [Candidatus Saccharimonadales bacterium]|nr:hypothetical protein [Candidatus Saccharimonadales bacterium]
PDGTTDKITLTATDSATPGPGEFSIAPTDPTTTPPTAATPADISSRFQAALSASIKNESQTTLAVASNFKASSDFFYSAGGAPQRIDGGTPPDFANATGYLSQQDALNETVQWYTGDNQSQTNARGTVTTKVDDSTSVNYGVQANEYGFTQLIRSLAVQSIQTYPSDDTVAAGDTTSALDKSKVRYDAVAARVNTNLSTNQDGQAGSLAAIGVDLGLTQTTLKDLSSQHTSYGAQLQGVLSDAETADPNEVVSALLDLQTRLSASYSAVAMLSQLQLANYLK